MDDDGNELLDTRAELQPILQAAHESSGASFPTIRALVMKVLSHPSIFCGFHQISTALQAGLGQNPEGQLLQNTLELFSYGRLSDYESAPAGKYLALTDSQLYKLRQLTILSIVQDACEKGLNTLSYETMAQEVGFMSEESSSSQVQDLVISCIYAQVLRGTLCQKTQTLLLTSKYGPPCCARDVAKGEIPKLIAKLQEIRQRLVASHEQLEQSNQAVKGALDKDAAYWKSVLEQKKQAETQAKSFARPGWAGAGGEGGDAVRRSSLSRQTKRSRGGAQSMAMAFHKT
jgi:hypothetical protein